MINYENIVLFFQQFFYLFSATVISYTNYDVMEYTLCSSENFSCCASCIISRLFSLVSLQQRIKKKNKGCYS